jgi:hypothetical protein
MAWAGRKIALRLDGHLLYAIADGALVATWPCPIPTDQVGQLTGARQAATPLPPPPLPAGSIRVHRRVHASGRIMVARQPIKLGPRHAGKLVTVIIEDTCLRILHGEEELAVKPRRDTTPITRLHVMASTPSTHDVTDALRPNGCTCPEPSHRQGAGSSLPPDAHGFAHETC